MTGDQSRLLKVGDRVRWKDSATDLGTVTATAWSGVTIKGVFGNSSFLAFFSVAFAKPGLKRRSGFEGRQGRSPPIKNGSDGDRGQAICERGDALEQIQDHRGYIANR